MEISTIEIAVMEEVVNASDAKDAQEISDMQLALRGGGRAAVMFG